MLRDGIVAEPGFYSALLRLAVPISLQQLVFSGLNAVDVLMIGQLGDTAVAAATLAYQVYFLMSLFLFGVGSGAGIFSAQYWGRGDVKGVHRSLGLALTFGLTGSLLFSLTAIAIPATVLGLFTSDPAVIALGAPYLRIAGMSYIPTAISNVYGIILRSTRHVSVPMAVSIGALSFKTVLAFGLIFGVAGLPALGVNGAAVATVFARVLEMVAILALTYGLRLPAAARPRQMLAIDRSLLGRFVITASPVILGEMLWSLGITVYAGIYAHVGTQSVTAVNIAMTIESIALVPFIGLANACAVMLGNTIGSGHTDGANHDAWRFLRLSIGGALLVGVLVFISSFFVLNLYRISPEAMIDARRVLAVYALGLWIKSSNMMTIVGILRSGGDTRFALFADVAPLWVIGIPLALFSAFVLHLPVYWIVLIVLSDELTKFCLTIWRVATGQWIHNVIHAI